MGRPALKPKVPRSAVAGLTRYWGDVPLEIFEAVVDEMALLGYEPCSWKGQNIGFLKDVSDDVRLVASVKSSVPHYGAGTLEGACDVSFILMSKLLAERSCIDDPWIHGPGAIVPEYMEARVSFHLALLSHLVWAEVECPSPQAWTPTAAGLGEMISTYKRLVADALLKLDSADDVADFIESGANYHQPHWVANSGALKPGTRFAEHFLRLLRPH